MISSKSYKEIIKFDTCLMCLIRDKKEWRLREKNRNHRGGIGKDIKSTEFYKKRDSNRNVCRETKNARAELTLLL